MAIALLLTSAVAIGCEADESATALNTEGPPMVRQVFMRERVVTGSSSRIRTALAFGNHTIADEELDDGEVTSAVAHGDQHLRIILDELVVGNSLEELACADGSFSAVPDGTTPDDVADCAGEDLTNCRDICISADGPVGILDVNFDGAADNLRFRDYGDGSYGANIVCAGQNIPLVRDGPGSSFYNPSGNQLVPAGGIGIDGLGPAVILYPSNGLRTGTECTVEFRSEVKDYDGNEVCASPGGDVSKPCDDTKVAFTVEALALRASSPAAGATGVTAGTPPGPNPPPTTITLTFNAAIPQEAAVEAITLSDGGPVPIEVLVSTEDPKLVTVTVPGRFAVDTDYVLTISTALVDVYGGELPAESTIDFTTRML